MSRPLFRTFTSVTKGTFRTTPGIQLNELKYQRIRNNFRFSDSRNVEHSSHKDIRLKTSP